MTYVSRPVRQIAADPVSGETAALLLRLDGDASAERVAEDVAAAGAAVAGELAFDTLAVEVPHERVADVCAVDGLAAVETTDTLTMDLDGAGEDVTY